MVQMTQPQQLRLALCDNLRNSALECSFTRAMDLTADKNETNEDRCGIAVPSAARTRSLCSSRNRSARPGAVLALEQLTSLPACGLSPPGNSDTALAH